jgi:hypothetical protein
MAARLTQSLAVAALLTASILGTTASAQGSSWQVEPYMLSLTAGSRYVATATAQNTSSEPIYVRANVMPVLLDADGRRVRAEDDGAISVFPSEFVLRPNSTFRVRLVANPARGNLALPTQSYYVRFQDVSSIAAEGQQRSVHTAFSYSFETLVSVVRDVRSLSAAATVELVPDARAKGGMALVNNTGRHIYLDSGQACVEARAAQECSKLEPFPRQSLLPGEKVALESLPAPYLSLMIRTDLNIGQGDNARTFVLKRPESVPSVHTVPAEPASPGTSPRVRTAGL